MTRRCVFFGTEGLTDEHAWPSWLADHLPGEGRWTHTLTLHDNAPRVWTPQKLDVKVKRVCGNCNHGWMHNLERDVRPFLAPMIEGNPRDLDVKESGKLAAWTVKTAYMLGFTHPTTRGTKDDELYSLYQTGKPPPRSLVWLASFDAQGEPLRYHHRRLGLRTDTDVHDCYCATMVVGHVALQILGYSGADDISFKPRVPDAYRYFSDLWPNPGAITWPPEFVLDDEGLNRFATRFEP